MEKKQFKAESKRLLDLVINSIYTNKDIFLRELISNASDAIDKIYYKALVDDSITFNREDYYIKINVDKENRELSIVDTGIGMSKEELDDNLGVIAKSGSFKFKNDTEIEDDHSIIGQFGVGFYSAFLVADKVTVVSKEFGSDKAYKWESDGIDGYTIEEAIKEEHGTIVILHLKENAEDEDYDQYLNEYKLQSLIKKYSDFIRYPIKMDIMEKKLKEGTENEYEDVIEEKTVNSMVPIWRKNKKELTDDDYNNFYLEKHFGFDKPLKHIHISVDGMISYNAILYIPERIPYDFYTSDYEKGLELYSNGVLIMEKCQELLPDYFGFVKGVVDSPDLSLNISREILQNDRQLRFIAKNIKNKIKNELKKMLKDNRDMYEKFFEAFGKQLKYGVYSDFGANKDVLQDLLMFYSSKEKKLTTLEEYVGRMKEDQKFIYYAVGDSNERIEKMPQTEMILDKDYEILYFTDDVDEFAIKMLTTFEGKEFRSVSGGDLGLEDKDEKDEVQDEESKEVISFMKETLEGKVSDVRESKRLKNYPVCLSNDGDLSIEMEKILNSMPNNDQSIKAQKVLEVNVHSDVFKALKSSYEKDKNTAKLYTNILYNQARLIEGLPIEDPVEFTNDVCKLMK